MTAVVVLAAGGSSRMGSPKQLLPFKGKTLVSHAVETAIEAALGPVVVVTGREPALIQEALDGLQVEFVLNAVWKDGIVGICF